MSRYIVLLCGIAFAAAGFADAEPLTLEQALGLARNNSPELRAARIYAQSAEKSVAAAGVWINPKLEFEAEGVGGDNDSFSEGEYTLGLSQKFQLGGKRKKERNTALKAVDVAGYALAEKGVGLANAVREAFVEVVYLQESGKVQVEQEELGRAFVEVANRRHTAGGGSELEVVQAELALEKILFAQTCCLGELMAAQEKLASLVGLPMRDLPELTAPYYELATFDALVLEDSHPTLQRLNAEAEKTRAKAQQARAQDVSDISLGAGYKYEAAGDVNTFVFAASMPLSFSKRGRAEHAAGLLRADAVLAERDEARRLLQAELAGASALYMGAKAQVEMGQKNLIPKAEQAYELSRAGYEVGRFSWLELIAAQQHLADIRIGYIDALKEAHLARIEILKLKAEGI
jgi:cobalt-zinc-cadmium efflux system outer membrane protein